MNEAKGYFYELKVLEDNIKEFNVLFSNGNYQIYINYFKLKNFLIYDGSFYNNFGIFKSNNRIKIGTNDSSAVKFANINKIKNDMNELHRYMKFNLNSVIKLIFNDNIVLISIEKSGKYTLSFDPKIIDQKYLEKLGGSMGLNNMYNIKSLSYYKIYLLNKSLFKDIDHINMSFNGPNPGRNTIMTGNNFESIVQTYTYNIDMPVEYLLRRIMLNKFKLYHYVGIDVHNKIDDQWYTWKDLILKDINEFIIMVNNLKNIPLESLINMINLVGSDVKYYELIHDLINRFLDEYEKNSETGRIYHYVPDVGNMPNPFNIYVYDINKQLINEYEEYNEKKLINQIYYTLANIIMSKTDERGRVMVLTDEEKRAVLEYLYRSKDYNDSKKLLNSLFNSFIGRTIDNQIDIDFDDLIGSLYMLGKMIPK